MWILLLCYATPAARPHFRSVFPLDQYKPSGVAGSCVIAGLATKFRERATGRTEVLPFFLGFRSVDLGLNLTEGVPFCFVAF